MTGARLPPSCINQQNNESMNRFYISKEQIDHDHALISGDDAKHISTVLRLKSGDHVILCNGECTDFDACIEQVEKSRVTFRLISSSACDSEPQTKVTLYQGLPKAGKLESIIQKSVELGVNEIVPFAAKRSVVRISKKDFSSKLARYQRIAYEAAKQCGRGIIPKVCDCIETEDINPLGFDMFLLPYEDEQNTTLKKALKSAGRTNTVGFAIGPEGGFDPAEAAFLREKGALSVTLGKRILRTETAGPATLAMLFYELEGDE